MEPRRSESSVSDTTPWLCVREAATYIRMGRKTLYRAIGCGQLKAARVGGRREIRVRREWLDQYLEQSARN
jgi:excisionase family DNA binding protein